MIRLFLLIGLLLLLKFQILQCQQTTENTLKLLKDSSSHYINREIAKSDSFANLFVLHARKFGNKSILADALLTKGTIQNSLFQFEPAREKIIEALRYFEKSKDTIGLIRAKLSLGMNHNFLDEFEKSLVLNKEILKLCIAKGDSDLIYQGYYSLGRVLGWSQYARKNRDTLRMAILYFKKALKYTSPQKDSIYYSMLYRGFGDAYTKLGNYEEALKYFEINLRQQIKQKLYGGIINSSFNMGIIYKEIGRPEKAIYYLKMGDKYADNSNYAGLHSLYQEIYKHYLSKNDYKNAFEYYSKFEKVNKMIIQADKEGAVTKLSKLYQTEKQESQLKEQLTEIKLKGATIQNQKTVTYFSLIALSIISMASIFYYRLYKENKASSQKNALLLKEQNHRVKNNLQVISALLSLQANRTENQDARKAIEDSQLRVQAMSIIHKKLYGDDVVEIEMSVFIRELIESILPIFGYNLDDIQQNIKIGVNKINVDKAVPIGLIINELLTNSCKYAFNKTNNPELKINFVQQENNDYFFTYHDNGPGFDLASSTAKGSFGLKLIELQSRQIFADSEWKNDYGSTYTMKFYL